MRMAHAASMSARPRKPKCSALDDALFAPLPAKGDVARSGDVEKCVHGKKVVWIRRRLVLGREALHLSRPGTDIAAESIPLAEIAHVVHANDSQTKTRKVNSHASDDELGSERFATVFSMQTKESGLFGGKTFYLRCSTELECDSWVKQLRGDVKRASQQVEREEKMQKVADARHSLMKAYDSNCMQVIAAIVMLGGFCTRIAESAIMPNEPANGQLERTFWIIDLVFIALYGTDLLLNFAAHCFTPFFLEWWNVYDVLVVSVSIASLCVDTLPGFSILRCLRLLKIGGIFQTGTASPRCLVNALTLSFLPILSTVAMFLLISCIYAVLAGESCCPATTVVEEPTLHIMCPKRTFFFCSSVFCVCACMRAPQASVAFSEERAFASRLIRPELCKQLISSVTIAKTCLGSLDLRSIP